MPPAGGERLFLIFEALRENAAEMLLCFSGDAEPCSQYDSYPTWWLESVEMTISF